MRILQRPSTQWKNIHQWEEVERSHISTGREKHEHYFTTTPTGIFQLDPKRVFKTYRSKSWQGARMPYSIFFNLWYNNRRQSGLAVHAATGSGIAKLGQRASGGCVRVHPQKMRWLYHTIQEEYRGKIPAFVKSNKLGKIRYKNGKPVFIDGFKVLLVIDELNMKEQQAILTPVEEQASPSQSEKL